MAMQVLANRGEIVNNRNASADCLTRMRQTSPNGRAFNGALHQARNIAEEIMPRHYNLLLNGRQVDSRETISIRSPYDGRIVGNVSVAGEKQMEAAVTAASAAFATTKTLPGHERSAMLRRIVEGLRNARRELARTIVGEAGKPITYAEGEVDRCILTFAIAAEEAKRIGGELIPLDIVAAASGRTGITKRFPVGPIAAITPFNFPLNLVAHKVAPALASGNTIVVKPAPQAPISALLLGSICTEAGVPKGAVNVVPSSVEVAQKLITDDRIKMLSFTGSDAVGWELKNRCGKKKVTLEMGGNAAVIVHSDCDLDFAAERIAIGSFAYAGQVCISIQRIYVEEPVYVPFKRRFLKAIREKVGVGDPRKRDTVVGPMIDSASADRIMEWIREARQGGARIICGGKRTGNMIEPTVLTDVDPRMKISCREAFGPVATLTPYTNFDDALKQVNDSIYGLQAGIFTRDIYRISAAFSTLDMGGVIVNDYPTFRVDNMPYGGVKNSGQGREGLKYAIEEMTELKLLVLNLS
jgi:acyl-CoA reductase-like NAD-dependent aldehyde dehydrogenase